MRTKRRNALKHGGNSKKPRGTIGKASINKWKRRDDVVLDEEDAFHENRDMIMLEGEENELSDDDLSNEVFALDSFHTRENISDGEIEAIPDETDEGDLDVSTTSMRKNQIKRSSKAEYKDGSSSSDSEIKHETWGRKKGVYYSTNVDDLDSDNEEDQQLEQAEIRRLQTESRAALGEEDFGLLDTPRVDLLEDIALNPVQPSLDIPEEPEAVIRRLEKTSPETLALAREWEDVVYDLAKSQKAIQEQTTVPHNSANGMLQLYHQTLLTYATTLAFYLHLRASRKYARNPKLMQAHPILSRLLTLKQAMSSLEKLDFGPNSDASDGGFDSEDYDDIWGNKSLAEMGEEEFLSLVQEAQEANAKAARERSLAVVHEDVSNDNRKTRTKEPSQAHPQSKAKKKDGKEKKETRKKKKQKQTVFDLEEPDFVPGVKLNGALSNQTKGAHHLPAFGEHISLDSVDAQDKSARKKSLQFYVTKIETTSAKRSKARGAAMVGDDDIPYREREKEREIRIQKEKQNRMAKLGQGGEDLEDVESETVRPNRKRPREEGVTEGSLEAGDDGYYELVKRQKKEEKDGAKALYVSKKAEEKALREGDLDIEEGTSGQRSLTRAILKNKGLTPTRPKTVRNPRVKKRMKFEQAKKKVRSQKAVFKGGLASTDGRYDGETSGISSKVVKSVRLG